MTIKSVIMRTELVQRGEPFSCSDLVGRVQLEARAVRKAISDLVHERRLVQTSTNNVYTYRLNKAHWLNQMRLSNYEPPRPAALMFRSPWLTLQQ